jgi:hypothetical protein
MRNYTALMKTISIRIDSGVHAWLKRESKRLGISKSSMACAALRRARREKYMPSCLDMMEDLCGKFSSGLKDLASNKKYMKDFGASRR